MTKKAIVPAQMQNLYDSWKMSPAISCNGFVFFTGFTGAALDGFVSNDAGDQFHTAFEQIELVLNEGGMDFSNVIEMTTFHIGLKQHLGLFKSVRSKFIKEPYPAWTAVEVAGFATEGVMIEIRIVAF